jgi:hypothetical protein
MTHKEWIEQQPCAVRDWECYGTIVGHHVRTAANSGTGMKPGDEWLVPLCDFHHKMGHQKGWKTFERRHGVEMQILAKAYAAHLVGRR